MPFEVRITAGAERDLAEIVAFLAEREDLTIAQHVLEVGGAGNLSRYPERGSRPKELLNLGIREFRQVVFQPYRLIYRISGKQVHILLVADERRDFQSLLERRVLSG